LLLQIILVSHLLGQQTQVMAQTVGFRTKGFLAGSCFEITSQKFSTLWIYPTFFILLKVRPPILRTFGTSEAALIS
jgi:hypothetical protein